MGKALIIKGANFSVNALGKMENTAVRKLGTIRSSWASATSAINTGIFGFVNDTNGYLTSIAIYTSGSTDFQIRVYRNGEGVYTSETYNTGNQSAAITEKSLTPIEVKSGDLITVQFLSSTAGMGLYKNSGGDIDTYTVVGGTTITKDSNKRIYPWNFHITYWTE